MKSLIYTLIFLNFFISCSDDPKSNQAEAVNNDSLPIDIQMINEGNKVLLQVNAQSGFGIQIDVPNVISVTGKNGLEIINENLKFSGSENPSKPEYYLNLEPMDVEVKGKGSMILQGKIFYCDFSKNICLPGKLYRELTI